jgi:HEAT repeat protein
MVATRRATGLVPFLALVLSASPCLGQAPDQKARDRYDRQTKGASIDEFVRRLNGDDPEKRLEAVKSLEESKDKKAIEYLVQALGDADVRVRAKAIDALGNMRAREASPVLIQQLFLRNMEPSVKQRLLASLGKIGDEEAAASILEFMQRDLDPATSGTAIFALGEIGTPQALPTLEEIGKSSDDPTLRRLATEAANKIRYHQAILQTEANQPKDTFLKDDRREQEQ